MTSSSHRVPRLRDAAGSSTPGAVKVPQVAAVFWVIKAVTTAFGESTSDWSVGALTPIPAVLLGFLAFSVALGLQLRARTYCPQRYWFAVAMVGVFGTMAADVLHVGLGVPYLASTALFAVVLALAFLTWRRCEGTLSVHSIDTSRRELFYWAAVVATFALGTAVGDSAAHVVGLGYLPAALLFAVLIGVTAAAVRVGVLGPIAGFWTAYVLTRPFGASVADWLGKPHADGGVGVGSGLVTAVLAVLLVATVTQLVRTGHDTPA
jgi:uncharacterized membrane-anchored protein